MCGGTVKMKIVAGVAVIVLAALAGMVEGAQPETGNASTNAAGPVGAALTLGIPFGDGMVIQRGVKAPVFGTAAAGAKITVLFRGQSVEAVADDRGCWRADVVPGEPGGPFQMTVKGGGGTVELKEVYVGDVWLCSGQSNMTSNRKPVIAGAVPGLRLGRFWHRVTWDGCEKDKTKPFPEAALEFGIQLRRKLGIPVGLVASAVGNTGIARWVPPKEPVDSKSRHGDLYVSNIRSIQPFAITGVIWWQGEADAGNCGSYGADLTRLIEGWRHDWGVGDFPFLFVQLQRLGRQGDGSGAYTAIREQQRNVKATNTAMIVSFDVTDGDLHPDPKCKTPVGERLALAALALAYGEKVEYSGPRLTGAERVGDGIILHFSHAAGMTARDGELKDLQVAEARKAAAPAKAVIEGQDIKIDVTGLTQPLTVRYAWHGWPEGNLYNGAGLPASPFTVVVK